MKPLMDDPLAWPILIVIGIALIVCALVIWLMWRRKGAPKGIKVPTLTEAVGLGSGQSMAGRWRRLWTELTATVRYLGVRREWRYATPWILLCGEDNSGRTSLAASMSKKRRLQLTAREEKLPFPGSAWHFFARGNLIDVNGTSLPSREETANWQEMLRQLNDLRPERALDGIVFTLSARTLRAGSSAELQVLAENCQRQLWELQQRFEFAFPVYIVVTQCDAIDGFSAFWTAQPESRREEIFGWSSPYALENRFTANWVDDGFAEMRRTLKQLQLQAAAADHEIDDVDAFFLFGQRFSELQTPLRGVLSTLFRSNAYEANALCRGIYFAGSIAAAGVTTQAPRADVAFLERLFDDKVFAELNLARPTRQGVWSRHRLIRRVQYATIGAFGVLCLALTHAGMNLHRQIDAAINSLELIKRPPSVTAMGDEVCIGQETVYELLTNVAKLDVSLTRLAIPVSWVDRHVSNDGIKLIADTAFEEVIFPSLACHLEQRARTLATADTASEGSVTDGIGIEYRRLRDYVERLLAFETNLAAFNRITAYSSSDHAEALLEHLDSLALYLYGQPLPAIAARDGEHREALSKVEYRNPVQLPAGMRNQAAMHLTELVERTRLEVDRDIETGKTLLEALNREQQPILANTQQFERWLKQARTDWLVSSASNNPCLRISGWLHTQIEALRNLGYHPALAELPHVFDAGSCYEPAMKRLVQLHVAPHGPVFQRRGDNWDLAPALAKEADGVRALSDLDYMRLAVNEPFSCRAPLAGWHLPDLTEAAGYIRAYQEFLRARGTETAEQGTTPLYQRLARRQLRAVLDKSLNSAQRRISYSGTRPLTVDALSSADQDMAQQSAEFAQAVEPLLWTLRSYQQLGDPATQGRVTQCARNYALQALQSLHGLAETSRLYEPETAGSGDETMPFFVLGDAPQTKDYLDRQLQRAQLLSSYAAPFATFLKNTDGVSDASPGSANYWDNTIQEVNRFVQFKVPNGQVALLNDLFLKRLVTLTPDNCDQLPAVEPTVYGNDLFSRRRRSLERQSIYQCHDRGRALLFQQYEGLARQFSSELAGRFPFGSLHNGEASLASARNFFLDYAKQRAAIRAKIGTLKGEAGNETALFLERLDETATFFGSNIAAADGVQPMRVKVEFRALPEQSSGAENVVAWRFTAGSTVASYPNGKSEVEWRAGQNVALELVWANLASVVPQADSRQTDMRTAGNAVTFESDGPWALLKLIQQHTPQQGPRFHPLDANLMLLEFRVPVAEKNAGEAATETRFFVGMRFLGVDPKTQATVVLKPPRAFPYYAPSAW